ncbi:SRP21 (YKL122C) [Zygosaccharomyces parabailii]|nr:SRP21 (YKL122C) [Zygosaccharomyces parabailii]CDH10232.1 related to Signal recognition particle subunit SRP21 [Zygosaccharomyces bailii ISA1307]
MSIKPIDSFISNSVKLFEANPSQTTFCIAYKSEAIPNGKINPKVSFKTHNAHLGAYYKFQTNKSKDVSRLLSALGPRGVTVTLGKVERRNKLSKVLGKKARRKAKSKDVIGMSTLMVNTDVKEYAPVVVEQKQEPKKKKSKSKGKKKR